jgi:transposase
MHATTYGLDVAKRVFQMYWVDGDTGEIVNRRFGRDNLVQPQPTTAWRVALEACGNWWARKIKRSCPPPRQVHSTLRADEQD